MYYGGTGLRIDGDSGRLQANPAEVEEKMIKKFSLDRSLLCVLVCFFVAPCLQSCTWKTKLCLEK